VLPLLEFLAVALSRLRYGFDVEWMEGALVGHAVQLLKAGHLYGPPSADFVPFIYPPLYTYVTAAGAWVFGPGYAFPRAVSLVSMLAAASWGGWIVWRATRDRTFAALAGLAPFAAYGVTGYWFDLVRVDSVELLLTVSAVGLLLLPERRTSAAVVASAVLLSLASFGKQSFLLFVLAAAVHLLVERDRRALALYGVAVALSQAVLWGGLYLAEGPVAFTYIFEVPRTHGWWKQSFSGALALAVRNLWTFSPILVALSLSLALAALAAGGREARRALGLLGWMAGAGVTVAILTRAKWGGYENAFIPAYFFLGLVAFAAAGIVAGRRVPEAAAGNGARGVVRILVLSMSILSSVTGILSIHLGREWVGPERRLAARQLSAVLKGVDGRVLYPSGNAAVLTGRPGDNHFHAMAVRDLSTWAPFSGTFDRSYESALESRQFRAILVERPASDLENRFGYRRIALEELGIRSDLLATMTGKEVCPRVLYCLPDVDVEALGRAARGIGTR
jgi:4-amino-4-deoxy-L-arabinose transferase-like glycosyltransferase